MTKIGIGIAAIALMFGTSALAADMAVKAPPTAAAPAATWTGFYAGVSGGAGWANSIQTDTFGGTSGYYGQSGGIVGGTIGANYQTGLAVLGVEADMSWTDIDGSVSLAAKCTAGQGTVCFTNMRWLNTDRVRVGAAFGSWMPYITAGVAGAEIKTGQASCSTPAAGAVASCGTITRWAPTFGAGVEAMFAPKWSAKLEWLYTDFGNNHTAYTVAVPVTVSEARVNIVRAGVNYRF